MKKNVIAVLGTVFFVSAITAQEVKEIKPVQMEEYNRWSIDINTGTTKPTGPYTSGYKMNTFDLNHVDLGARYMLNNKFGVKADLGYDKLKNASGSLPFESDYYRVNLQGVVNLGRVLNFENWTERFNVLAHAGAGYSFMTSNAYSGTDNMANVLGGITGQLKLSERISLNADFTMIKNAQQNQNFDGNAIATANGFNGTMYNATVGVSIYLGKNSKHADWYFEENPAKKLAELDKRVGDVETNMNDTDRDGVPDYLDVENNSIAGVAVDSKGRMVDLNKNGVPDELEKYLAQNYIDKSTYGETTDAMMVKKLINEGYISTYFDVNKATPTNDSADGIAFMLTYLRSNPSVSVDIIGNADETGNAASNDKLALARANTVKNTLVKAGIDSSRLNVISKGEDKSVDVNSRDARRLVRRVIFQVK